MRKVDWGVVCDSMWNEDVKLKFCLEIEIWSSVGQLTVYIKGQLLDLPKLHSSKTRSEIWFLKENFDTHQDNLKWKTDRIMTEIAVWLLLTPKVCNPLDPVIDSPLSGRRSTWFDLEVVELLGYHSSSKRSSMYNKCHSNWLPEMLSCL